MTWAWPDEKRLGVQHLERMARSYRRKEANERARAERYRAWTVEAESRCVDYRERAEAYERAAAEVRGQMSPVAPAPASAQSWPRICGIATVGGWPCRRKVWTEGQRCWQHRQDTT